MRLIDTERLAVIFGSYKGYDRDSYFAGIKTVADAIDAAPTVDAVPVVHGYWTEESECSQCGKYVYKGDIDNFCPHCGARMDEDEQHS